MTRFIRCLGLTTGIMFAAAASAALAADDYPSRPVRWMVGFPAGGANDIVARILSERLSQRLGQRFYVENKAGDSNNLATQVVATAPPDGYTLHFVNAANFINATLYTKLPFDFLRDIAPVVGIMRVPNVLEVHPSVPATNVAEFIAYAKANPGKLNMASSGVGTSIHLAGELFKVATGTDLVHVPYKGTPPALTDLIAGHVQVIFDNLPSSVAHIKAGRVRALAVTTLERAPMMPELTTVAETVPGFESSSVFGVGVPRGTPPAVIEKLNREINAVLAEPEVKARLQQLGGILIGGTPADFEKLSVSEVKKWGEVIKASGAKLQ